MRRVAYLLATVLLASSCDERDPDQQDASAEQVEALIGRADQLEEKIETLESELETAKTDLTHRKRETEELTERIRADEEAAAKTERRLRELEDRTGF